MGGIMEEKRTTKMERKKMTIKNKIIAMHIKNLFWEFDRMSSSGQQTLNNLAEVCGVSIYEEDEKEEK